VFEGNSYKISSINDGKERAGTHSTQPLHNAPCGEVGCGGQRGETWA
jgi:hypothetical protein